MMDGRLLTPKLSFGLILAVAVSAGCSQSDNAASTGNTNDTPEISTPGVVPDGGIDAGSTASPDPIPLVWNWVPIDGATCRNGSNTGIGINPNPSSDKLVILLEGGGACFDSTTCQFNRSHYGQEEFDTFAADADFGGGAGLFDRTLASNPVRDWNFVYVPYCTGDVHAGNNPQGFITDLGPQQFVGYVNVGLYLQALRVFFPEPTQILLTGVSAGGFGAVANYAQVARAFDAVPVTLLDDSGPPMGSPYVAPCLASLWIQTWNLDKTVMADCGTDCADTSELLMSFQKKVARSYPDRQFALIDSTEDWVISAFFGFGSNDCGAFGVLSPATFTAGLSDIRAQMTGITNFGTFLFAGAEHTTLLDATNFPVRTAGTTQLPDYVANLLAGQVSNVGP